jgi:uroporphyrinogen-III synthase
VTRPDDASGLAARLVHRGAWVEQVPLTRIEPLDPACLDAALASLAGTAWLCLTSANAVRVVAEHVAASSPPPSGWRTTSALAERLDAAQVAVAAVGEATAQALDALSVHVDVVATKQDADGLADALTARGLAPGARVLFPTAEGARETLPARLRAQGADVTVCTVYRSVPDAAAQAALGTLIAQAAVDLVTVTAPSVVRGVAAAHALAQGACPVPVASIGPVTTAAAVEAGLTVACEADPHSAEGLVAAIERWCAQAVRS